MLRMKLFFLKSLVLLNSMHTRGKNSPQFPPTISTCVEVILFEVKIGKLSNMESIKK